jgi:hypothetical protein
MAVGEWIKMRPVLLRHPKVIAMADFLATRKRFIHWLCMIDGCSDAYTVVSRDAVTRVTVASLLVFWCDANSLAEGGLLRHANRHACDAMAGIPDFGEALVHVGWAIELPDGKGLQLPNFQEFNTETRQRTSGAERTARWRERKQREASQSASHETSHETSPRASRVTQKEGSKEGSKQGKPRSSAPDGVDEQRWQAFRESRQKLRRPMTDEAERLAGKTLSRLVAQGYDAAKLIDKAIELGWQSFYGRDDCRREVTPSARAQAETCPCGAVGTVKVGGKWRCSAHVRQDPLRAASA